MHKNHIIRLVFHYKNFHQIIYNVLMIIFHYKLLDLKNKIYLYQTLQQLLDVLVIRSGALGLWKAHKEKNPYLLLLWGNRFLLGGK